MKKHSLIRTIYLYLFTIIGLVLLVIGCVRIVDMALKAWVFTQAEQDYVDRPPIIYLQGKEDDIVSSLEQCEFSEEQEEQIDSWLADYGLWKEEQISIDYTTQKRHRDMSQSLAFILIGLPLYLYHWSVIKRETK